MRGTRPLIFPENAVADITYIDLQEAVLRREFFLEHQPKVNLRTSLVESMEALIRWQHSSRRRIAPDGFLPLIERTTLVGRLTGQVLDQSLAMHFTSPTWVTSQRLFHVRGARQPASS